MNKKKLLDNNSLKNFKVEKKKKLPKKRKNNKRAMRFFFIYNL